MRALAELGLDLGAVLGLRVVLGVVDDLGLGVGLRLVHGRAALALRRRRGPADDRRRPDAGRLALGVGLALALAQAGVGFGFEGTLATWTRSAVSGGGGVLSRSSAGGTVITSAADA